MLDPRIYRAAFVPVVLAIVALAFSLYDQQGPLGSSLAPDAFNAQNAWATMQGLSRDYPDRTPGSSSDTALAGRVEQILGRHGFSVSTDVFSGRTADGKRTLETVVAQRPGFSSRAIVVVAHRDALGQTATADMSGTATLLEMARVLSGRTLKRNVVLASTSASVGAAGAVRLAHRLAGSVDAVLVLGDLASSHLRQPLVVPWSDGQVLAPPVLRNTVQTALGAQAGLASGSTGLAGQFAHLAFPVTPTEQGPFGEKGEPAVLLSASGERPPADDAPVSLDRLSAFGRTALQTVGALEDSPSVPGPEAYLIYDGKVVPGWAIRILVLSLMLPVLAAAIDGLARARRRRVPVGRWIAALGLCSLPFAVIVGALILLRVTALLHVAPPEPVDTGLVSPHTVGIAILVSIVCLLAVSGAALRPLLTRLARRATAGPAATGPQASGAVVAVPLVMCSATFALWVGHPFTAALIIPALNLWTWALAPEAGLPRALRWALVLTGFAPLMLIAVYYAVTLGLGPIDLAWSGVLMVAGGHIGAFSALTWSVLLGCTVVAVTIAAQVARAQRERELPITVRGPITYAGPGSLGGTESALRR